ncbi:MAG TPA: hypothetical protein PLJ62_05620 [Thermoflexales bacterium]|nr:hypothetical protein [Thermoflexales bacterium]
MTFDALISAFDELAGLLRRSEESLYAQRTPAQAASAITREIDSLTRAQTFADYDELRLLFAPTGALQEIAIDNGWGEAFLRIAAIWEENER